MLHGLANTVEFLDRQPIGADKFDHLGVRFLNDLLLGVIGLGGIMWHQNRQYEQSLAKLAADLAAADAKVSELAEDSIPDEAQEALQAAVYLIARKADGKGLATAWAFGKDQLATNAHVAKDIKGHERDYVLISPNGDRINIATAEPHPGYFAFQDYKARQGKITGGDFTPLVQDQWTWVPFHSQKNKGVEDVAGVEMKLLNEVLSPSAHAGELILAHWFFNSSSDAWL